MRTTMPVPPAVVEALRPELSPLADEIIDAIRREVPEYDRPLQGQFGRGIRTGVVAALERFGDPGAERHAGVYRALGRGEHRVGRSLDALQSAYRVGARVAWRRLSAAAAAAGVAVAEQHALAEAIFAYIDELAAESVEGYAEAQADVAGDLQRRRETVLRLLVGPGAPDPEALAAAAQDAAWPLPVRVAVLACEGEPGPVARRLGGDALHGRLADVGVVVAPAATTLVAEASVAAERCRQRVAVGPATDPSEASRSLRWATAALALPGAVVVAEERLADLVLSAAPDVLAALRERALAPLADQTPASRDRLARTLRSWLRHAGARAAVAAELGVHPQTVRYRVGRLRELFGDRLEDPDRRLELLLALHEPGGR